MPNMVTVIDHPLVQHKLSHMRDAQTDSITFRTMMNEVGKVLALEAIKELPLTPKEIETPVTKTTGQFLDCDNICLVSILRAGNGLTEGIWSLIPEARVAHVGVYRDPATYNAVEYYFKVPSNFEQCDALVIDPMLATGHSAVAALDKIKKANPKSIRFICLLAAPEGIEYVQKYHPDVPIVTASVDECLNEKNILCQDWVMPEIASMARTKFRKQLS